MVLFLVLSEFLVSGACGTIFFCDVDLRLLLRMDLSFNWVKRYWAKWTAVRSTFDRKRYVKNRIKNILEVVGGNVFAGT